MLPMCNGKLPTQKHIWTVSFYQGVPRGMPLEEVAGFAKNRTEAQDRTADAFVGGLLFLSSSDRKKIVGLKKLGDILSEERSASLIETGPSNFISCSNPDCSKLSDPVNSAIVKTAGDNGRYSNYQLRPIYYVEGIIDPDDYKYDGHRHSSYSYPSAAYVDWQDYFERHTFIGGDFLVENYFAVPDSVKKSLCKEVGRDADCFGPPKYEHHNEYIPPKKCDIRDGKCLSDFATRSPFQYLFLMDQVVMCGNSCFDNINKFLTEFKENPFLRQKWEDAIAKDIFLQISISKTRKVEKDWIVTRIEWNPTLFCQYARPNSDLLSQ